MQLVFKILGHLSYTKGYIVIVLSFGPALKHETCLRWFANNKGADQPALPQSDQLLCYSLIGKYHI